MKKIILFMLLSTLAFVGCNKDNDDDSLDGSTWVNVEERTEKPTYTSTTTIEFKKTTATLILTYKDDTRTETEQKQLTYTYNHPVVELTMVNEGVEATITGNIDGNKLTLSIPDEESIVFVKR